MPWAMRAGSQPHNRPAAVVGHGLYRQHHRPPAARNLAGGEAAYAGCLGTGVVRLLPDLTAGRTGLTEEQARRAGYDALSVHLRHRRPRRTTTPAHPRLSPN